MRYSLIKFLIISIATLEVHSSAVTNIKCTCKKLQNSDNKDLNECEINELKITEKDMTVDCNEIPSHIDLSTIHQFNFTNSHIEYFPKIAIRFKEIRHIIIENASLKEIHQADFAYYPNLYRLVLTDNEIKNLESNLFASNYNVKIVNLNNNKIETIQPNVFDNLTMKALRLRRNNCIDEECRLTIDGKEKCKSLNKFLITVLKKCYINTVCQKGLEKLEGNVIFSLVFNLIQLLIILVVIIGIVVYYCRLKKKNNDLLIESKNVVIMYDYDNPRDIYHSTNENVQEDYTEPVGTPSRPATLNKGSTINRKK